MVVFLILPVPILQTFFEKSFFLILRIFTCTYFAIFVYELPFPLKSVFLAVLVQMQKFNSYGNSTP